MATKTIYWPDETLPQDIEDAAFYLNYKDEIEDTDPESPTYGEMIPNPVSKVQTILTEVKRSIDAMIEAGAAKRADSARLDAIAAAKLRTANITIE